MDELNELIEWYKSAAEFAEGEGWDAKKWTATAEYLTELKERRERDVLEHAL